MRQNQFIHKLLCRYKRANTFCKRFGLLKTCKYILIEGIYKHISNYINYLIKYNQYPQNIIFLISLPKSGSSWITNMLSGLDGFAQFAPLEWNTSIQKGWDNNRWNINNKLFYEFRQNLAVIRGHTWPHPENIKILYNSGLKYLITVRDPRDQIISEYWHNRVFPQHWRGEYAKSIDISEFISEMFISGNFERETLNWLRGWLNIIDKEKIYIIKYEDLLEDTFLAIENAISFLGFECSKDEIKQIIQKNKFEMITKRKRGDEDKKSFMRKGVSGEWKKVFSLQQKNQFYQIGEDVVNALNYEPTI